MEMKKYFSYSDEEGFKTFDTKEQAETDAKKNISHLRDYAVTEGWPETSEDICCGQITGYAKEFKTETSLDARWTLFCDYQMEELK